MPIYEYECLECGRISDHLVLNPEEFEPYCKHCGTKKVKKIISRVRVRLSLDTRIERMADPSLLGSLDENDPKSVMKLMQRMGAEFGSELGDEFDEIIDMAEEEIEEEMTKGSSETDEGGEDASLSDLSAAEDSLVPSPSSEGSEVKNSASNEEAS